MNGGGGAAGGRSPSDALIIGSGNSFLFPQQIVFIAVFHHFAVCLAPDGDTHAVFLSWVCSPDLLLQAIALPFFLMISGGVGGWGVGEDGENANAHQCWCLLIALAVTTAANLPRWRDF